MLRRCVALNIVAANRLVYHHLKSLTLAKRKRARGRGPTTCKHFKQQQFADCPLGIDKYNRANFYGDKRIENRLRKLYVKVALVLESRGL